MFDVFEPYGCLCWMSLSLLFLAQSCVHRERGRKLDCTQTSAVVSSGQAKSLDQTTFGSHVYECHFITLSQHAAVGRWGQLAARQVASRSTQTTKWTFAHIHTSRTNLWELFGLPVSCSRTLQHEICSSLGSIQRPSEHSTTWASFSSFVKSSLSLEFGVWQ